MPAGRPASGRAAGPAPEDQASVSVLSCVRFFIQLYRLILTTATKHFRIWSDFRHAKTTQGGAPRYEARIAEGSTTRKTKIVSFLKTNAMSPPDFTRPNRQAA